MLDNKWYTSRELCIATGITYHSLGRALPRWVGFEYLTRQPIEYGGSYAYRLEPKARKWLSLAQRFLPNYKLFIDELKHWQQQLNDNTINLLLSVEFKPFVATLNDMVREFKNIR